MKYPLHLTLRTGMVCPDGETESLSRRFLELAAAHPGVPVSADGIVGTGYTGSDGAEHGIVAYAIAKSAGLLSLHAHLLGFTERMKGAQGDYHPHVSLCYHDLTPEAAAGLSIRYRDALDAAMPSWRLQSVELWREDGGVWVPFASTNLC